jgi:hypothetical protein
MDGCMKGSKPPGQSERKPFAVQAESSERAKPKIGHPSRAAKCFWNWEEHAAHPESHLDGSTPGC